jgi:hypothetical protein
MLRLKSPHDKEFKKIRMWPLVFVNFETKAEKNKKELSAFFADDEFSSR